MATRTTPNKSSFNAGEFSPMLSGREDLDSHQNSNQIMENMIGTPWGPAMRRPGTRFICEVKDSAKTVRLLDFEFGEEQAYCLEVGEGYFRFIKDQGQIWVDATDAVIVNGDFGAGVSSWADVSTGGAATISHDATNGRLNLDGDGVNIARAEQSVVTSKMGQEHVLRFRVLGAAGDVVQLGIGTTSGGAEILAARDCSVGWYAVAFTPTASPFYVHFSNALGKTLQIDDVSLIDDAPVELAGPLGEIQLARVMHNQSADTLYVNHGDHPSMRLERRGHADWALVEIAFIDGPYLDENIDTALTLTPSAVTGLGETLTASKDLFVAADVGRLVRLSHAATWGYARIVAYVSPTVATIDIKSDFGAITATDTWKLGIWSETTGYPVASTFHQERLVFGGASKIRPSGVYASKPGDFYNMTPGGADGDPLAFNLLANKSQAIRWLASAKKLVAGTQSAEAIIRGDTDKAILTPTNIDRDFDTSAGSSHVAPVETENATLFVQRHGRKVKELAYSLEADGMRSPDMTIRASHITKTGIKSLAYQKEPWSVIWGCRNDGLLIAMTYEREEKVVGWHRHPVGGQFNDGPPRVEDLISIPGEGRDEPYLLVKRTINGVTKRYIEMIEAHDEDEDDQADAFYVDCGFTYSGAATTTISGLDPLEGETVVVLAGGARHPDCVVTGGQISLEYPVTKAQIGLGSRWVLVPQRFVAGSREGTSMGKPKRYDRVDVFMHRTLDVKMGPSLDKAEVVNFREVGHAMDTAIPLFTGVKSITYPGSHDKDGSVYLSGDGPFPATITNMIPRIGTDEG